jgi:hypothetical protein
MVIKYDMLVRLFFARNLTRDKLISILEQHLEQIHANTETLEKISHGVGNKINPYQAFTLRYGLDFYAFLTNWHENLLTELKQEKG